MTSVLVVNAGSTSLKLSAVDEAGLSRTLASLEDAPDDIIAVGHRVVHGGPAFRAPVLLDDRVLSELRALVDLAPLHNAPALAAIDEARRVLPGVPHVAVFDTEFHATIPPEASTYAVPERWREQWHVRRYGFHGLAVQWASEQVAAERLVVCHLGGGCSVSAVLRGRSVDTTMGFSPLEGVVMATRSGSLDPAAILHLLRRGAGSVDEIEQALERESGLLGLSGLSARVEELERASEPSAQLALGVYCYRIARAIGAMCACARRARRDRLQRRRGGGFGARPGARVRPPRLPGRAAQRRAKRECGGGCRDRSRGLTRTRRGRPGARGRHRRARRAPRARLEDPSPTTSPG